MSMFRIHFADGTVDELDARNGDAAKAAAKLARKNTGKETKVRRVEELTATASSDPDQA